MPWILLLSVIRGSCEIKEIILRLQHTIEAFYQGNWSLSIKLRLECFVIVE